MKLRSIIQMVPIIVAMTTMLISFKPVKINNPNAMVTYNYVSNTPYQRTLWTTNPLSLLEKSIDKDINAIYQPYFRSASSWTTNPVSFIPTTDYTKYIGSITFEEEAIADGGNDGQLTLQEAVDALYWNYMLSHTMPSSLAVGIATIHFTAATMAH